MSRRPREKAVAIAPSAITIEELFASQVARDWRSIAIRQAAKEFASTLHSILNEPRSEYLTDTEDRLLQLIPQLLTEAVKQQHRDLLTEAIGRLAVGHEVDLMPLLSAAVDDLRRVSRLHRTEEDHASHL